MNLQAGGGGDYALSQQKRLSGSNGTTDEFQEKQKKEVQGTQLAAYWENTE